MDKLRSFAAIARAERSIEATRLIQAQANAAIRSSLDLLKHPVFPADRRAPPEQ